MKTSFQCVAQLAPRRDIVMGANMRRLACLGMLLLAACAAEPANNQAPPSGDPTQLTQDEIDLVKHQIEGCWNLPAASDSAVVFHPEFRVAMNRDGNVRSVDLLNPEQLTDQNFAAAADSAKGALLNPHCQPLKFPAEKYEHWQTFTVTFANDVLKKSSFEGAWSATVGPQGACDFESVLLLQVSGFVLSGGATNPWGTFPLTGRVEPGGEGVFKIGAYSGVIRFSGNIFEASYANDCGARFARGFKQSALNLSLDDQPAGDASGGQ